MPQVMPVCPIFMASSSPSRPGYSSTIGTPSRPGHGRAVKPDRLGDAAQADLGRLRLDSLGAQAGLDGRVGVDLGGHDDLPALAPVLDARGGVDGRAEVVQSVVGGHGDAWALVDADLEQ